MPYILTIAVPRLRLAHTPVLQMLRHRADLKSLAYLVSAGILLVALWRSASIHWGLYALYVYLSIASAVIAHNHNHVRIWSNRFLDWATDVGITLFYGFPVFGWIPTHNRNHHKYTNTMPDETRTWRFWRANNVLTLLTYPLISGYYQQHLIRAYLMELRRRSPRQYLEALSQGALLTIWVVGACLLDWRRALLLVILPQQIAMASVLCFNYIQHVHADEEHELNHSRNFTGRVLNALLFNNGFHTVHHLQPGLHWSLTPAAHREIAGKIDPALNEPSLFWYLVRTYLLSPFRPVLRRA